MPYRLKFTETAFNLIAHFPPELKKLLREALTELQNNPALGKFLKEELAGYQSLARKRYRIIYKTDDHNKTVWVYFAGHRKDIYELFRTHLGKR